MQRRLEKWGPPLPFLRHNVPNGCPGKAKGIPPAGAPGPNDCPGKAKGISPARAPGPNGCPGKAKGISPAGAPGPNGCPENFSRE